MGTGYNQSIIRHYKARADNCISLDMPNLNGKVPQVLDFSERRIRFWHISVLKEKVQIHQLDCVVTL
ncbi:hypothetical protein C7293_27835 [filamentous cyanobacterium CCT1]|nr:hypothetical protein C7293_27835 [filamentous cyanobacterium CCT1]